MLKKWLVLGSVLCLASAQASSLSFLEQALDAELAACTPKFITDYNNTITGINALADSIDAYNANPTADTYAVVQTKATSAVAFCAVLETSHAPAPCTAIVGGRPKQVATTDLKEACTAARDIDNQVNP